MILAVDMDGTLCEHVEYPNIGKPKEKVIKFVKNIQSRGGKIILWTCRNGDALKLAVEWCKERGIIFDAINEDIKEEALKGWDKSCKIHCDFILDDKNITLEQINEDGNIELP